MSMIPSIEWFHSKVCFCVMLQVIAKMMKSERDIGEVVSAGF